MCSHLFEGRNDVIRQLLDMGIHHLCVDEDGRTFIHIAASHGQLETLENFANKALCMAVVSTTWRFYRY
mgnify:CR=1 FL=1